MEGIKIISKTAVHLTFLFFTLSVENEPRRIECLFNNYDSDQSFNSDQLREVLVNEGIISPSEIIVESGEPPLHVTCHVLAVTIVDDGFCDNSSTTNDEYGDYVWTETAVGEMHRLQCVFGPVNTNATRQCASRGQWSGSIDYSSCFTRITMMYQMFDVVSFMLSSPTVCC